MVKNAALSSLIQQLDYTFKDETLLIEALTHRSAGSKNNERLEFLGDGILNFVIANELFQNYPDIQEGDLSRLRACLVNGDSLADIARELDIGSYLKLGSGELKSGGFRRSSILADAVEAILGAVYCDGGFGSCRALILRMFKDKLTNIPDPDSLKDAKTKLQELLQSRRIALPVYNIVNVSGKAHSQIFLIECRIDEFDCATQGKGRSRRKAEQIAAELAFKLMQEELNA